MTDPRNPDETPETPEVPGAPVEPEVPSVPEPDLPAPAEPGVPGEPEPVVPVDATASGPEVPGYAAPAYGAAPAKKTPVFSLISLIAGIVGLVGFAVVFLPFIGGVLQLFIPAAAVVLGFIGKSKEPQAKGMWLTGIILGFVGIGIALLSFVLWGVLFSTADYYSPSYDY